MKASVREVMEDYGFESIQDMTEAFMFESIVPACCSHGCEVEPDGKCEHGYNSILIEIGIV